MAEAAAPAASRIRVAANGKAAAAGALVMFGLATQTQSVWIQVVGAGLVGLLAVSFAALLRWSPAAVGSSYGSELAVGETLVVHVHVRNRSSRSSRPMRITLSAEHAALFAPFSVYVDPLTPESNVCLRAPRSLAVRGWSRFLRADAEVMAPFGFFSRSFVVAFGKPLIVGPGIVTPINLPAVLGLQAEGVGAVGPGLDVRGVREWRPGDTAHHVHWRSTARTGRLTVLDYGEPQVGCVGVLVAGLAGEPRFEAAVAVAAATARQAMTEGVQVVVAGVGDRIEQLTTANWHQVFARVGAVRSPQAVDDLVEVVGSGGVLVLAAGAGVAATWSDYATAAATRAGVRVVDAVTGLIA